MLPFEWGLAVGSIALRKLKMVVSAIRLVLEVVVVPPIDSFGPATEMEKPAMKKDKI